MESLRIKNISLIKGKTILQDISCEVGGGEILIILGPSGSGKSSLLRCLNRLESIDQGEIFLNDVETRQMDVVELRRKVGMVFQTSALLPQTVKENLRLGPQLHKQTLTEEECESLLGQTGLSGEFLERHVDTLSVGELQRVTLAQVLANHPEALLLDEPTSALDPSMVLKIEELIKTIHQNMRAITLLVTHNIDQALRFNAQTIVLIEGKIIARGNIRDLMNREDSTTLKKFFDSGDNHEH
ncbi:MAG: ATP-binding cassette domain-containing protein [Nitrospinota bacterium]|nr:ATP-binding cassette domain-containing protein [Nitrospinota bacterium]